ncbi:hypothetical protein BKA69DRAFT_594183 [Paraphysoderma sedebokerense]|nr:hypothetical protein BKA69DRAFT_594183 [Paraphysoderma sedebokerense]
MTFLLRHRKYQRTFFFVLVAILVSLLFSYFDSYYDGLTNSTSTQNLYYRSDHFFDAEDQAAVEVYANGRLKLQNDGRRDSNYAPETDLNSRLRSLKEYVKELKSQKFIDTKKIADLEDIIRRREMSLSDSAYKDQGWFLLKHARKQQGKPEIWLNQLIFNPTCCHLTLSIESLTY